MLYPIKLWALRHRFGRAVERRWARLHGDHRAWWSAEQYIEEAAPGCSVADVGGMYGIDGEYSFIAERAGATSVTCVDTYVTEAFTAKAQQQSSSVQVVIGDAMSMSTIEQVGVVDLVMCLGVLYHVPDPARLIRALRAMCGRKLILETFTTPEVRGVPHAGVYLPHLSVAQRRRYLARRTGGLGIASDFEPAEGYANNFWALSPSCVSALLRTYGFRVTHVGPSPNGRLRHIFLAEVADELVPSTV